MAKKKRTRRYHFSLGDSSDGPIGFCAAIMATSKEQAVRLLRKAMPLEVSATPEGSDRDLRIEYIGVYFNERHVEERDIDEVGK